MDPHVLMRKYFQAFLGNLVPGFIHNINSPLQVLSFAIECIDRELKESFDSAKLLDRISMAENQVRALSLMIKDMRALERMGTFSEPLTMEDTLGILQRVLMCDLFCKHGVKVDIEFDRGMRMLRAEGAIVIPALCELVQNSLRALRISEDRHLIIKAYSDNERGYVEVIDNGCGLPGDISPDDLFKPGITMWPEGIKKAIGDDFLGMGLYCVKEVLTAYGSGIELCREGGFTVARMIFPHGNQNFQFRG